jgi:hypothetical protein
MAVKRREEFLMAVYSTPLPPGPGLVIRIVCFTGATAAAMRNALLAGGVLVGAILGLVLGIVLSLVTGPEVLSKLVGALVGLIAGGAAAYAYLRVVVSAGACTCPPGSDGFCVGFSFWVAPFGPTLPTPPFIVPVAPGACAIIPAGCP